MTNIPIYATIIGADLLAMFASGFARADRGEIDSLRTYRRVRHEHQASVTITVGAGDRLWHFSPIGRRPSPTQLKVLCFIIDRLIETQALPTVEEIQARFGVSKSMLVDLTKAGFIIVDSEITRIVRVLRHPDGRRLKLAAGLA